MIAHSLEKSTAAVPAVNPHGVNAGAFAAADNGRYEYTTNR